MSDTVTTGHRPMEAVHIDDRPWETLRWPGQWSKMLFHPRPECATEPNAGLVRYEPGSHHPLPPGEEIVDLGGRAALPGLVDAHGHLMHLPRVRLKQTRCAT